MPRRCRCSRSSSWPCTARCRSRSDSCSTASAHGRSSTAGMVLMALGQLVMAFASDVGIGILARVLIGAGDAAVFPSVLRSSRSGSPTARRRCSCRPPDSSASSGRSSRSSRSRRCCTPPSWSVAFGSLAGLGVLFSIITFTVIRNHPPDRDSDVAVDTETGAIRVVTSAADLREGFRESWAHPATRLAFWSHFATPFAGTAFVMLWGFPFLTAGRGALAGHRLARRDVVRDLRHRRRAGDRRPVEPASDAPLAHARAADDRDPGRRVALRHRVAGPGAACGSCSRSRSRSARAVRRR